MEPTQQPIDPAQQPTPTPTQPVTPTEPTAPGPEQSVPQQAAPSQSDQPAPRPGNHKPKILLVEDDDSLASVYETRLQAENFDTKRVPNGEDALSAAIEYKPDLIILDVMMPKVSGFDVLDILRNTPETANVKVIMLTALSQDSDKQKAQSLGVDDYLVKSQVVIADVVQKIKEHLGA